MNDAVIELLKIWAFCSVAGMAVVGVTAYAIVKVLVTGKAVLYERQPAEDDRRSPIHLAGR